MPFFEALHQALGIDFKRTSTIKAKRFDSGMATQWPLRILLAEDNVINQKVSMMMLTDFWVSSRSGGQRPFGCKCSEGKGNTIWC